MFAEDLFLRDDFTGEQTLTECHEKSVTERETAQRIVAICDVV